MFHIVNDSCRETPGEHPVEGSARRAAADATDDPALVALADRLLAAALDLHKRFAHACVAAASSLTAQQHLLLQMLNLKGPLRISDLAEILDVQPSAVTMIVDRLADRGLVRRERDVEDRRAVLVRMTGAGKAEFCCTSAAVREYVTALLAKLDTAEIAAFTRIMEKLTCAAEERPVPEREQAS